jgi:Tol biopolymer transport system component
VHRDTGLPACQTTLHVPPECPPEEPSGHPGACDTLDDVPGSNQVGIPFLRGRVAASLLAVCVGAAVLVAAGTAGASGGSTARLVIAATHGGSKARLYTVGSSGALKPLGAGSDAQTEPALSSSGSQIAFVQVSKSKCYACPLSVWLENANGSGAHILTPPLPGTNSDDGSPSFSPTGEQIVFARQTNIGFALYVASVKGGTPHDLFVPGVSPSWGPSRIAYVSPPTQAPGPLTLWTVDSHGGSPKEVTTGYIVTPVWSTSGSLAFLDQPPQGPPTLVVSSGSSLQRYSLPFAQAKGLAWSPDGKELAVVAATKQSGPFDVYTVGADGKGVKRLTTGAGAVDVAWGK